VLENLFSDVRYALRWLRRSPAFTLVAIASLAIGIGFNTALFTLVDALLFRPLPGRAARPPGRRVHQQQRRRPVRDELLPDFLDLKAQNQVFTDMLAYSPAMAAVKLTDRSRLAMGETVTGNYFQLLGVNAIVGRTLLPEDDTAGAPRAVVISYRLWNREYAASPSAVGQSIRIQNQPVHHRRRRPRVVHRHDAASSRPNSGRRWRMSTRSSRAAS
jgi:hypothetical protein